MTYNEAETLLRELDPKIEIDYSSFGGPTVSFLVIRDDKTIMTVHAIREYDIDNDADGIEAVSDDVRQQILTIGYKLASTPIDER